MLYHNLVFLDRELTHLELQHRSLGVDPEVAPYTLVFITHHYSQNVKARPAMQR